MVWILKHREQHKETAGNALTELTGSRMTEVREAGEIFKK
jgi:hypothetical protein